MAVYGPAIPKLSASSVRGRQTSQRKAASTTPCLRTVPGNRPPSRISWRRLLTGLVQAQSLVCLEDNPSPMKRLMPFSAYGGIGEPTEHRSRPILPTSHRELREARSFRPRARFRPALSAEREAGYPGEKASKSQRSPERQAFDSKGGRFYEFSAKLVSLSLQSRCIGAEPWNGSRDARQSSPRLWRKPPADEKPPPDEACS